MKHLSLLTGLDLSLSLSLSHLSITIFTLMYFNEISGLKHSLDTPNHSRDIMNVRNYCTRKSMAYEMNPVQLRTDNNHFSGLGTSSKSWTPDYLESSACGLYWWSSTKKNHTHIHIFICITLYLKPVYYNRILALSIFHILWSIFTSPGRVTGMFSGASVTLNSFRAPLSIQGCKCVPANYHPTKCLEGREYPFPDFRDNNCDSGVILWGKIRR